MLYCGKPPKEKYKKTGENIKKHDLFIYFSFGANGATSYTELTLRQVPAERLSGLNGIERRYFFNHGFMFSLIFQLPNKLYIVNGQIVHALILLFYPRILSSEPLFFCAAPTLVSP